MRLQSYPEIYFSRSITRHLSAMPPIPEAPKVPDKPVVPQDPGSFNGNGQGCSIFMLISGIIALIVTLSSDIDEKVLAVLGLLGLIAFSWFLVMTGKWDRESHEEKKEEYNRIMNSMPALESKYQEEYSTYLRQKRKYDMKVKMIQSETSVRQYRKDRVAQWLESRSKPDYTKCDSNDEIKKGLSEEYFSKYLEDYFSEIYTAVKVPVVGDNAYYPDILLVTDSLYIDIEIDEPYVGSDGTPIHYYSTKYGVPKIVDEDRNKYMTDHGFEVIRFSEEQIFRYPEECVDYIVDFVNGVTSGLDKIAPFEHVVRKWSIEESAKLAYKHYRATYVPPRFRKLIERAESKNLMEIEVGPDED